MCVMCDMHTSVTSLETAIKSETRPPYCYCIHLENVTTTNLHVLPKTMIVRHLDRYSKWRECLSKHCQTVCHVITYCRN
jgi:hypothetical protein